MTITLSRFSRIFSTAASIGGWHTRTVSPVLMGVSLAVLSNVLFGMIYGYGKLLHELSGTQIFLWRMLMMWLVLVVYLSITGRMADIRAELSAIKGVRGWLLMLLPTPILASQFWLFMWAPVNGQSVQVTMGYFLLPLTMVLSGCVVFGERLTRFQKLSAVLAAAGVAAALMGSGSVSLATLWVCGTYPVYYVLRRMAGVRALTGLLMDMSLIAPVCLMLLMMSADGMAVAGSGLMLAKVVGLGILSVLAMATNIEASRLLPVSLFGMLGYLEPVLMFMLSITVLGGVLTAGMFMSYGLIMLSVGCLIIQGILGFRARR